MATINKRAKEPLCEVTGKPCTWASDDEYDERGDLVQWDLFCLDCKRFRDWEKDEATDETT